MENYTITGLHICAARRRTPSIASKDLSASTIAIKVSPFEQRYHRRCCRRRINYCIIVLEFAIRFCVRRCSELIIWVHSSDISVCLFLFCHRRRHRRRSIHAIGAFLWSYLLRLCSLSIFFLFCSVC